MSNPGRHRGSKPAKSSGRRPFLTTCAALAAAGLVSYAAVAPTAAGESYGAPCVDATSACTQARLAALEQWAAGHGASTATVTVTRTTTRTATISSLINKARKRHKTPPTATASNPASAGGGPGLGGRPFIPYTADSFFRSPIAGASISRSLTAAFRSFMATFPEQRGVAYPLIRGVGGNRWGTVYAEGRASDPVWRLTGNVPKEVSALSLIGFHAPASFGAQLTGTSDSPFVVMDRASGWSVWGAKARVAGNHLISVGTAGLFDDNSNGLDRRNPRSNSKLNFRSRGAIPDAMVIRRDLMDYAVKHGGDLGHVLHLFFVETSTAAGAVSPMTGFESSKAGFGAEGMRIAIDPQVDLAKRGLSPQGLVIARTLQHYGAYIGDNSGGATALKAQQDDAGGHIWGNSLHRDELKGLTWSDFVVIQPG